MDRHTAAERLVYADSVERRLKNEELSAIAAADQVGMPFVLKAVWLGRRFTQSDRQALGPDILKTLTPSHLEVVATAEAGLRLRLLRRAAAEALPVRDLRRLAREDGPRGATNLGGASDLNSACRALRVYADWTDADLERLVAGPNGSAIRGLAMAGRQLAERLEGVMSSGRPTANRSHPRRMRCHSK
jgi:hypothetical protein